MSTFTMDTLNDPIPKKKRKSSAAIKAITSDDDPVDRDDADDKDADDNDADDDDDGHDPGKHKRPAKHKLVKGKGAKWNMIGLASFWNT
jgi:hypothetical protein